MPDISFYVLPSAEQAQRHLFACKLLEKAYRSGHFCYVLTDTPEQSQALDDLLWTFRSGSFIPHQVFAGELPRLQQCILIGQQQPPDAWLHTVLNLSSQCPDDYQRIGRILEILDDGETTKVAGRQRYRHYQQAGFEPTVHKL
ncbi:DNA polymerase III subunit chi [Methylosoma difficile]